MKHGGNRTFRQRRFGKKNSRRFGKFFCRNVRRHVFAETSCSPLGYVPISSSAPRPLGAAYIPILLSEVEQEQRPSGNGDREAIVVGAGLCDGEGERAYIAYQARRFGNFFSLRRFGIFFAETSAAMFLPKRLLPKRPESSMEWK